MRYLGVLLFLPAERALAHPGHGMAELVHLLTEPDHLAAIVFLPLVAGLAWRYLKRR